MTSSSQWPPTQRSSDVSGLARAFAFEKKNSPSTGVNVPIINLAALCEDEELQLRTLWAMRDALARAALLDDFVSPDVIRSATDGSLSLIPRPELDGVDVHCKALTIFNEQAHFTQILKRQSDAKVTLLKTKQDALKRKLANLVNANSTSRLRALDSAYTPLHIPSGGASATEVAEAATFGSPTAAGLATEASPASDDSFGSSSSEMADMIKLEIVQVEDEINLEEANREVKVMELRSKQKNIEMICCASREDVLDLIYSHSMQVAYQTLEAALGISEIKQLAVSANVAHKQPADQVEEMWSWITRSTSRLDQDYYNRRFNLYSPFEFTAPIGTSLQDALRQLIEREQRYEQMGITIPPPAKLSLRMRLVPSKDDTRVLLHAVGVSPYKEVSDDTLRAFELQLANYPTLKAECRALRTPREQHGAAQSKPTTSARLAQQTPALSSAGASPLPRDDQSKIAQTQQLRSAEPPRRSDYAPQSSLPADQQPCIRHQGQHSFRDCPFHPLNRKLADKVVKFNGQAKFDGNSARSSKATATLRSARSLGSFAVLSDLDDDDCLVPLSPAAAAPSPRHGLAKSAHVLAAKGGANCITACADSGASMHLVPEQFITEDKTRFVDGIITWGDGSSSKTTISGTVNATLVGKDGTEQKISFPAWGVPQLETPLLSATAFAREGAALHVEKGNTYLDFRKLGGKRVAIADDCLLRFNLTAKEPPITTKANKASASSPASKPPRRRRSRTANGRARRLPTPGN